MCLFTTVYAASDETSQATGIGGPLEIKREAEASIEGYKQKYGSDTYGVTAFILDKIRIYSIPLVFIGLTSMTSSMEAMTSAPMISAGAMQPDNITVEVSAEFVWEIIR